MSNEAETLNPTDYDLAAYVTGTPEQRLRLIRDAWGASKDRQRAFFEGQMLALTVDMEQHPEWFDHGCMCALCRSYGV